MKHKIKPIGRYILVKPEELETTTKTGIVVVQKNEERPQTGIVAALGTSVRFDESNNVVSVENAYLNAHGMYVPFVVKEGDKVLFRKYGGNEVELDGEKYLLLTEDDILAVFNE